MGTLFSALDIGRAGLQVAQVQLDITAHNIANVNKEGYSRQRVELVSRIPNYKNYGAIGRGPGISDITRLRDAFNDTAFRQATEELGSATLKSSFFSQIEDIFDEPSEDGFSSRLDTFFSALSDFSDAVEDNPVRVALLSEAQALAAGLNDVASRLEELRTNANEDVRNIVPEINSLTSRIAELNDAIRRGEATGSSANDLRDDRDLLLDELSELANISYHERADGQIDVLIGGDQVVTGTKYREIYAAPTSTIDPDRPELLEVRFVDTDAAVNIRSGELAGAIETRDTVIPGIEAKLDDFAQTLIYQMNRIQSSGNGLSNIAEATTSTNGVISPFAPFNFAQLPYEVVDGSLEFYVYDSSGNVVDSTTISITATGNLADQTTLSDLQSALDALSGVSTTIDAHGRLTVTPDAGNTFTFANDTSGALAAIGFNNFFTGDDAASIAVSQHLLDHPEYISSGYSTDPLETGDNTAALDFATLRNENVLGGGTQTFSDFYEALVVQIGVDARTNEQELGVQQAFVQDFTQRRAEVSGVNLDEEVTNLVMYQRAYEAAARIITVADRMLETLMNVGA